MNKGRAAVFEGLKERRKYNSPKPGAEAKAITDMLKAGYTPEIILKTWDTMKEDNFWSDKELTMMTLKGQIGAKVNAKSKTGFGRRAGEETRYSEPFD